MVKDPRGNLRSDGQVRNVTLMTVDKSMRQGGSQPSNQPTSNPRAQLRAVKSGIIDRSRSWFSRFDVLFPNGTEPDAITPFKAPVNLIAGSSDTGLWFNVDETYGPPYNGGGPLINILHSLDNVDKNRTTKPFGVGRELDDRYGYSKPFPLISITRGAWYEFIFEEMLSTGVSASSPPAALGGYVSYWWRGPNQTTWKQELDKFATNTLSNAIKDGPWDNMIKTLSESV